jgi:hypothetical protein
MPISPGLVQLCFELDRFHIAAAIGHISNDRFVHWNHSFETRLGLSPEEMKTVELRNIIITDAPLVEASGAAAGSLPVGRFSGSVIRVPGDERQILGRSVQRPDGFVLTILDDVSGGRGTEEYARGYLIGLEQEKQRARQVAQESVGGNLLAASFAAENAKKKLEDEARPEAEDLKRVTYLIDQAINDLVNAFTAERLVEEQ